MKSIEMVDEFHKAFGMKDPGTPYLQGLSGQDFTSLQKILNTLEELSHDAKAVAGLSKNRIFMRLHLSIEELAEMIQGVLAGDVKEILDALTDRQYVLDGDYLTFGLEAVKDAALQEVHSSNMSKLDENGKPILSDAGRVLKSDRYVKPDLRKVLEEVYGGGFDLNPTRLSA